MKAPILIHTSFKFVEVDYNSPDSDIIEMVEGSRPKVEKTVETHMLITEDIDSDNEYVIKDILREKVRSLLSAKPNYKKVIVSSVSILNDNLFTKIF